MVTSNRELRRLRDAALVAGFDLFESLRSRKVLVLLALYVAGAMAAAGGFVRMLHELEGTLAEALKVSATDKPGALTDALMASEELRRALGDLVGDPSLVDALIRVPVLALFYGWMAFTFVPALVTFTSCDAVSSEVATGSSRFALFRAERISWALGKLGGQAALMGVGILGGALGTWIIGAAFLSGFSLVDSAWWLARLSVCAWWKGLPYLGLAMGVSLATRTPNGARALALAGLIALGIGDSILANDHVLEYAPVVLSTLRLLFPGGYTIDHWRPDIVERAPAMIMQLSLAIAYFSVGFARFYRRDA